MPLNGVHANFFSRASLEAFAKTPDFIFQPPPVTGGVGSRVLSVATGIPQAILYPLTAPTAIIRDNAIAKLKSTQGPLDHPAVSAQEISLGKAAPVSAQTPFAGVVSLAKKPFQSIVGMGLAVADILTGKAFNKRNPLGILEGFAQIPIRAIDPWSRLVFNVPEGIYNVAVNAIGKPEHMRGVKTEALALNAIEPRSIQWAGTGSAGLSNFS